MISNWYSSTKWKSSFLYIFSLVRDSWGLALAVKTEAKKAFTNSAFSVSSVSRVPAPFSNRHRFSLNFLLLLMNLKKRFLMCFMSLDRFNSKWDLAVLLAFLLALTTSLCSSWVACPCFHLLYNCCLCLSFFSSSLFIHADILLPLLDFLLIGMHRSWVQKKWSLNINQLSSMVSSHGILPRRCLKRPVSPPKAQSCDLTYCPASSWQNPELNEFVIALVCIFPS